MLPASACGCRGVRLFTCIKVSNLQRCIEVYVNGELPIVVRGVSHPKCAGRRYIAATEYTDLNFTLKERSKHVKKIVIS